MNSDRLIKFLKNSDTHLVLADIGASGEIWDPFKEVVPKNRTVW